VRFKSLLNNSERWSWGYVASCPCTGTIGPIFGSDPK